MSMVRRKNQEEIASLVHVMQSEHPEELESIAELVYTLDARIESQEYKIKLLKDTLRKIQGSKPEIVDACTVTTLVAKRQQNGVYDKIHRRFMETARDDLQEFFKEIGLPLD
jgi:hypothetical protein